MKKRERFWSKLRNKYKLTILNESTYAEVLHFNLSRLQVLIVVSTLAVVLVGVTTVIIAFTNLREFIPGYPDSSMRWQITQNALRVDSLEYELEKRDRFFNSIRAIVTGEVEVDSMQGAGEPMEDQLLGYDSIKLGLSEDELQFREIIEQEERFNLSWRDIPENPNDFYNFFPPIVGGIVTAHFDEKIRHYGVDLVAKQNSNVFSVLSGVVIFSDWTMNTGYVIQIQHNGELVSVYKHNSILLKRQGDMVKVGEAIAIVGNTGEETTGPHLHFELWRAGQPVNPELYIKFD